MSSSKVIRKFERMFSGIANEEDRYTRTLEAEWKTAAENELRISRSTIQEDTQGKVIGTIIDDFKNQKEIFVPPTEAENQ